MFEHLSNIFKKVFNSEETVSFALIIIVTIVVFSFFASVLTPFIISIIVAYLLVGLQKKIQSFNISESMAGILAFAIFIIVGAAMFTWLIPLISVSYTHLTLPTKRIV